MKKRFLIFLTLLILSISVGAASGLIFGLFKLTERANEDLKVIKARFEEKIESYLSTPSFLAKHPMLFPSHAGKKDLELFLFQTALSSGVYRIAKLSVEGEVVGNARVNPLKGGKQLKKERVPLSVLQQAKFGSLGKRYLVEEISNKRLLELTYSIRDQGSKVIGYVAVYIDLSEIDYYWGHKRDILYFVVGSDAIFTANRSELILQKDVIEDTFYLSSFKFSFLKSKFDLASWCLHFTRQSFVGDMTIYLLVPLQKTFPFIFIGAVIFGLTAFTLISLVQLHMFRQKQISDRLTLEYDLNQRLEETVHKRTKELKAEIKERKVIEYNLREAQNELVKSAKLRAIGEISVGISHELNQPIFAIQNLVSSSIQILPENNKKEMRSNIDRIGKISERMAQTIQNIRKLAREETDEGKPINLQEALEEVVQLLNARIKKEEISIVFKPCKKPVIIKAGPTRLQQVLINVLSNAFDAVEQEKEKLIEIWIEQGKSSVTLFIKDTGVGLNNHDLIFEPFYTTKAVGKGVGLGLSISHDIIRSFGGEIIANNHPEGGAVFSLKFLVSEEVIA